MLDHVHPAHAAAHDLAVGDGADHDLGAPLAQFLGLEALLVVEGDNLVPQIQQPLDQRLAREPRAARDEYLHAVSPVVGWKGGSL